MTADPDYFSRFFNDIGEASLLEVVLRGHLWVESELLRSLEAALPFPNRIDLDRMAFGTKVDLLAAQGLMRQDERPGFRRLNAMRNRMAHHLGQDLAEADQSDLLNALGTRHREHIRAVLAEGLPGTFPFPLKYAITGMCIVLQVDRQRMQQANERLRAAAQRLLSVAGQDTARPPGQAHIRQID